MDQWFISIDHQNFRQKALAAIDSVNWIPDWGKNRIESAVKTRPDWCISRQRTWGVPIPAFYDAKGEAILDAGLFATSPTWSSSTDRTSGSRSRLLNFGAACGQRTGRARRRHEVDDTLDVWIDSGSSSRSVLMRRSELHGNHKCQADMYLEGSDQHRGWFNPRCSSPSPAMACRRIALC